MRIGLTGSIACGKSTVANMFKELGAYIIDADEIAHEALKKTEKPYKQILDVFGFSILDENKNIDRKKLGSIVLKDKQKLAVLESIIHPYVQQKRKEIEELILQKDKNAIIIYDVPLLFEKQLESSFDKIIVVYVPKDIQIERLMKRQNLTYDEALNLVKLQMDIEEKKKQADFVIDNSYSLEDTRKQVIEVFKKLY
ncbi:MAG TPA: dephospho-CoA kinase [Desulfurella acetivorans]|jgi:dephospho-CoA kinase|uniref:Dephospho-CoA kinase n=1 Tax=Desulfurella acetivorans TaxID=33002 RepID=A0A7C6E8Z3_DESAE|nr:dephospho-CoA kinase [Desulfurella acetivorans]